MNYQEYQKDYRKKHYTVLQVMLRNDDDADIIAAIHAVPNRSEFIRDAIKEKLNKK